MSLSVEEGEASDFSLAWDSSVTASGKCPGAGGKLGGVLGGWLRKLRKPPSWLWKSYSSRHIPVSSPDYPVQRDFYISSIWSIKSITYGDSYALIPPGAMFPSCGHIQLGHHTPTTQALKLSAMGVAAHSFQPNCIKAALIGPLSSNRNQNSVLCLPGRGRIIFSGGQTLAHTSRGR